MANINIKFPTNTPRQLKLIKTRLLMKRIKKTLLVIICLTLVSSVFILNTPSVYATNITTTNMSLQISDSRLTVAATYLFTYTASDTTDNVTTIVINLCSAAAGTCTIPTGLTVGATPTVTVKFNTTPETNTAAWSSPTLTITITTPAPAQNPVTVSFPVLTNPSSQGSIFGNVTDKNGGSTNDYGVTGTAIVNGIGVGG